jgi:hypothetical protein
MASFSKYTASSRAFAWGATLAALGGGALGSTAAAASADLFEWLQQRWVENPKGFGFYL